MGGGRRDLTDAANILIRRTIVSISSNKRLRVKDKLSKSRTLNCKRWHYGLSDWRSPSLTTNAGWTHC